MGCSTLSDCTTRPVICLSTDPAADVQESAGLLQRASELTRHLSSVNNLSELLTNAVNRCSSDMEKEVNLSLTVCYSSP